MKTITDFPAQNRRVPRHGHRHAGRLPAVGARLDAGGRRPRTRCRRSSSTCPTASATAPPRATPHPSLFRRPRLCLDPRRHARQRRLRRADGGRIFRAGAAGRLRRDRLGRGAALVQRQGRHDGHLLGRLQRAAGRRQAAAGAEGDHHALLDRRPLCRRHPLQGRAAAQREHGLGRDHAVLFVAAAGSGDRRRQHGATCGWSGWRTSRSCRPSG